MKRILTWLLAILMALPCCAYAQDAPSTTIMVYMSGSDLETDLGYGTSDIREMVRAGVDPDGPITLLLATGGAKEWSHKNVSEDALQYHRITSDGLETLKSYAPRSMGETETLAHFLDYGMENYPAGRYMLILWGHGDGPAGGVCFDQNFQEDGLLPDEITAALAHALDPGEKIDAIVFDSCLMACADLLWAMDGYADWVVASQETTVGSGMVYHEWIAALANDPGMHMMNICRSIADSYMDSTTFGIFSTTSTISVLNVAQAGQLRAAADRLYRALDRRLDQDPEAILSIREAMTSCGTYTDTSASDQVDALAIADAFSEIAPAECAALRAAAERCVAYNLTTKNLQDVLCGVSLFMPYETFDWFYQAEDFYGPQAEHSAYARFIMNMIEAVEDRHGGSLAHWFRLFDSPDAPAASTAAGIPIEDMWMGLEPSGSAPAPTPEPAREYALEEIWTGLTAAE